MSRPFFVPSERLPGLRSLAASHPSFAGSAVATPLRSVVDANVSIHELKWMLRGRQSPSARSHFREVVEAGLLEIFAPPQHEDEVVANFSDLHRRYQIPMASLEAGWKDIKQLIHWIPARPIDHLSRRLAQIQERAPKDVPYVSLAIQIGAAGIITHDRDFESCDVAVYRSEDVAALRAFARSAATELTIVAGGSATLNITCEATAAAWRGFRRLTPPTQVALGVLALGGLALFVARRSSKTVPPPGFGFGNAFSAALAPIGDALVEAHKTRQGLLVSDLANNRPLAMVDHAAIACARARRPLAIQELVTAVLAQGLRTRSLSLHQLLSDALREDRRFTQLTRGGGWALSSPLHLHS